MKNTFGHNIAVTLFGESHGAEMGATIDGLCAGLAIDENYIAEKLALRRPSGEISTARKEADGFRIVSGVYQGKTTGAPLTVLIPNENVRSGDYANLKDVPRPSHADYTAEIKYRGFQDPRGGGHFSGRVTAPLVAVGAIAQKALEEKGVLIGTHICRLAGIEDREIKGAEDLIALSQKPFPVLDAEAEEKMKAEIVKAKEDGDSVGGSLETVVLGLPAGLGEPFFDSVESRLAHILFSVPAVKGVEFGAGFALADMRGSEANDGFYTDGKSVFTKTNRCGGILGGITNGMPVLFRTVVKPTPSIFKEQNSVSLSKKENTVLTVQGRHDPCIVHRARAVVDAVTAICLLDFLATR